MSDIRNDVMAETQQRTRRSPEPMLATQLTGQRPAYIDNCKKSAGRAIAHTKADGPSRPSWDGVYIKKLFAYFCEDGNGAELADKWKEGAPNSKEVKMALDVLLDIGI